MSSLYLARRYLAHHAGKTAVLAGSITLILFLPAALEVLVARSARELTARADATPLLVGAKGSPTELVLNSLYFGADVPERTRHGEAERIAETGFALAIPLYVRFRAGKDPIVGTTLDYFAFRGLAVARGRTLVRLGDCVLGARVAERRGLGPGDRLLSSPENVFDLAGVYPLRMRVTGVLAAAGTPDDDAVFVDLKTAWVIEGLAHGHADVEESGILAREEGLVVANASVVQYNEITEENVDAFHLHGDPAEFPLTAVIAVPLDEKAAALLRGRYERPGEPCRILRPRAVMDELLGTVLTVEGFVLLALGLTGAATLATAALVFALSLRLRRREIETLRKIGASRRAVAGVLLSEILGVLLLGALCAALLTLLTAWWGADLARSLLA